MNKDLSIALCLCTHNPDGKNLSIVLDAIARQKQTRGKFRVLIVDNASFPPLDSSVMDNLRANNISCQLIQESQLGLVYARARAIRETTDPLILFVDDDNELCDQYVCHALEIAQNDPGIGCFGGKILLPSGINPPTFLGDYVRFLAIRDEGETAITRLSHEWGPWEPVGAGAVVRRELADLFLHRVESDKRVTLLGRKGKSGLYCCEDNLMMRSAAEIGLKCSYQPVLSLTHHMTHSRFKLRYMLRLLYWFGRSEVVLNQIMCPEITNPVLRRSWLCRLKSFFNKVNSPAEFLCEFAIRLGRQAELKRRNSRLS